MPRYRILSAIAVCLGLLISIACSGPAPQDTAPEPEPTTEPAGPQGTVDFSFVFFGCNRIGWDPSVPSPSTANVAQLKQTVADIAALPQAPRYLFMLGDIVRNEQEDDGQTLEQELSDWQTLWDGLKGSLPNTQLVPLAGNHEVLYSTQVSPTGCDCKTSGCDCRYDEFPNPAAYEKWATWLSANGYDSLAGNGPTPETDPQDELAFDGSNQLTYSFASTLQNGKKAHFVLVDTDALSSYRAGDASCIQDTQHANDPVPGWMAAHWVDQDIAAANADDEVEMIFAMGHKPIQTSAGTKDPKGRDTVYNCPERALADQFLTTLKDNDKVAGYLTAHDHNWWNASLDGVQQIVAGNAGSPPDPDAPYFGFTLVEIYTSGEIVATSYGRKIPDPIDDPNGVEPATARTTVKLR